MVGSDLPEGTANDTSALDFNQGVEALADILGDPDTDLNENEAEKTKATPEAEAEGEEPEGEADDEALDIEVDPDPSEESGPGEIKGGQFAPDTAKVTLEDGTVISIADLKRNNLFQRDYSQKTEALKHERTALDTERNSFQAEKQSVQAQAQQVSEQRDFLVSIIGEFLPPQPTKELLDSDLVGYMQAKDAWDRINQLHALKSQDDQRKAYEDGNQRQTLIQQEAGRLYEKLPDLKDPAKMATFKAEVFDVGADYGFGPDELNGVADHRVFLALKDLVRLKKALKKAPQVKQQVQQKPKLISGGKRMDPQARVSREAQGRSEQLRKSGSMEAGVASLMDLDL